MASLTTIASNEKGTGNIFCYTAYVLSTLILVAIVNSVSEEGIKSVFFFIPFLFLCLVIYLIGRFLNSKFNRLGVTPLTVGSSFIRKGVKQQASIQVNISHFNCVNNIQLACLVFTYSTSGGTALPDTIYEQSLTVDSTFGDGTTTLHFEYEIPKDLPSSDGGNAKTSIIWQLSFKFREGIEEVSRTWNIDVR